MYRNSSNCNAAVGKMSITRTLSSSSPLNACQNTFAKLKCRFGSSCGDTSMQHNALSSSMKKINNEDSEYQQQQHSIKSNHSSSCLHLFQNPTPSYQHAPVLSTFKGNPNFATTLPANFQYDKNKGILWQFQWEHISKNGATANNNNVNSNTPSTNSSSQCNLSNVVVSLPPPVQTPPPPQPQQHSHQHHHSHMHHSHLHHANHAPKLNNSTSSDIDTKTTTL